MSDWRCLIITASNNQKWIIVEDHVNRNDAIAEAESRIGGKCREAYPISKEQKNDYLGKTESKSNAACFVATVAYGNANHPDVSFLRLYRDTVLIKSKFGRCFINWYYRRGPQIAEVVERSELLKKASRLLLSAITKYLNKD